jgi:hypothetical protein
MDLVVVGGGGGCGESCCIIVVGQKEEEEVVTAQPNKKFISCCASSPLLTFQATLAFHCSFVGTYLMYLHIYDLLTNSPSSNREDHVVVRRRDL